MWDCISNFLFFLLFFSASFILPFILVDNVLFLRENVIDLNVRWFYNPSAFCASQENKLWIKAIR